jgi:AraC family transcriptional regulator, arabinose operon regulatory protein
MDQRVQIVLELIDADTRQNLKVTDLARCISLSPSRLHHLFKASTGTSLLQYLKVRRLQKAKELLETTTLNIKETMNVVGFTDASHFVRDFKRKFGTTPSKYKRHHLRSSCIKEAFFARAAESANK